MSKNNKKTSQQPKQMFSNHQVLMNKFNSLEKEYSEFANSAIQTINHLHGKVSVLEIVLSSNLLENVEVHNYEDFEEEQFSKDYGFLFKDYFLNLEDQKTIIKVIFPEEEMPQEELADELLDNSK
jgi:hypothetical protein